MTTLESLHEREMETADLADSERRATGEERDRELFRQALQFETAADARLVSASLEPTRSILFRSAASLALDCGLYSQAAEPVGEARSGAPPPEISEELTEIELEIQRHAALLQTPFKAR